MTNIINEQHYLDLTNQLKVKFDEFESENIKIKNEINYFKKKLFQIYGLISVLDDFIQNIILDENSNQILEFLIDSIRSICNDIINNNII